MDDEDSGESLASKWSSSELFSRGVVLYVEDHEDTRVATGMLMRAAGLKVNEAATAESAMALADSIGGELDVLIVDYHLGGETTGTEVAEVLARRLGHGLPTVILTGDPANAEVPWLKNSPVWLIRKPASPVTLIAGLWPLIEFRRAMKRAGVASPPV